MEQVFGKTKLIMVFIILFLFLHSQIHRYQRKQESTQHFHSSLRVGELDARSQSRYLKLELNAKISHHQLFITAKNIYKCAGNPFHLCSSEKHRFTTTTTTVQLLFLPASSGGESGEDSGRSVFVKMHSKHLKETHQEEEGMIEGPLWAQIMSLLD